MQSQLVEGRPMKADWPEVPDKRHERSPVALLFRARWRGGLHDLDYMPLDR
jgi:hypothetical protein